MEKNLPHHLWFQPEAPDRNKVQENEAFGDPKRLVTHPPCRNSRVELPEDHARGARAARCIVILAALLLLCGCASTHATDGKGQALSAMPEALIGVWHRNDSDGRQACEAYRKITSANDIDEESNALLGGLIITKHLVHSYAEYGEGDFYAIKRVVDLDNRSWEVDALIGIDTLPSEGDAEGTFRFAVDSGLLSMNRTDVAEGGAYASGFFRCGEVLDGL